MDGSTHPSLPITFSTYGRVRGVNERLEEYPPTRLIITDTRNERGLCTSTSFHASLTSISFKTSDLSVLCYIEALSHNLTQPHKEKRNASTQRNPLSWAFYKFHKFVV